MTTLRELVVQSEEILNQIIESGGELTPELEERIKSIDISTGEKIDSYKFFINKLDAENEFWKKESETRQRIARGCATLADRLEKAIKQAMIDTGKDEIEGPTFRAKLSPAKKRLELDVKKLPDEFKVQVVSMEPDKEKIASILEGGGQIEGAKLEGGYSLRFYTRRVGK